MNRKLILTIGVFASVMLGSCSASSESTKVRPSPELDSPKASTIESTPPVTQAKTSSKDRNGLSNKLKTVYQASKMAQYYRRPSPKQLRDFRSLIVETLGQSQVNSNLVAKWNQQGWNLQVVQHQPLIVAIAETPENRQGGGLYFVRLKSESKLVLQAPHRYFDKGTGVITRKLFAEHDCRAAAWNTVHRSTQDLAHRQSHFFNAFTRAFIEFESDTRFVQIHGFANEKQSGVAKLAKVIVSDGTNVPARHTLNAIVRLKEHFGKREVLVYPSEIRQLGGTTNAQGAVIRDAGSPFFLHLELNAEIRKELANTRVIRGHLFDSLAD